LVSNLNSKFFKNTFIIILTYRNSVESVATKHRNNSDGPRKCPDNFWFMKSKSFMELQYEFLYLEVSGGPFIGYTKAKEHIKEDQKRLARFCKDSWDYLYYQCEDLDSFNHILHILNVLKLYALHIHG